MKALTLSFIIAGGAFALACQHQSSPVAAPVNRPAFLSSLPQKTTLENKSQTATDFTGDDGLLIDFRSELALEPPPMSEPEQRKIIRAALGADDFKAEIASREDGSFTAANQSQTAYLISIIRNTGKDDSVLAIFERDNLVTKLDARDYRYILRTSDLNHDGVNELLLSGGSYQMGETTLWAKLIEVDNNTLRTLRDFKTVLEDSCDNPAADFKEIRAVLVSYQPRDEANARMPSIKLQRFHAPCSTKRNGKRYAQEFEAVGSAN